MIPFVGLIFRPLAGFAGRSLGRHFDSSGKRGDGASSGGFDAYWDPDDLARVNAMWQRLEQYGQNLQPLLDEIGSTLEQNNRERFKLGVGPDGVAWVDLSPRTWAQKTTDRKLYERGDLFDSIRYEVGQDFVQLIGGPTEYAAAHQFGFGDIPARPYLGMSSEDADDIMDAMSEYIARIVAG